MRGFLRGGQHHEGGVFDSKVGAISGVLGTKVTTARTLAPAIVATGLGVIPRIPLATSAGDTKAGITNMGEGPERTVGAGGARGRDQ
jgi:hypothetical protein